MMRAGNTVGWTVLGLAAALAACGETEGHVASGVQIETLPSGMVRVTNDGSGQWTEATAWRLVEDLRLGSADQAGAELFGAIGSVVTDAEDRIFVLDRQAQDIRVFSPAGEHLRTMGGRGDGPGELTSASALTWGPDGSLWVYSGARYFVLDPSTGRELARHTRPLRALVNPWPGGFSADGRFLDWGGDRETTGRETVGNQVITYTNGRTTFMPIAFTPPDRVDTLPTLEYWHPVHEGQLKSTPGTRSPRSLALHVAPDGIWFAHPDEYTIYRRTLDGDTLLAFSHPSRPETVPTSLIDSIVAAALAAGTASSHDRFEPRLRLIRRIVTDRAGHVWVFPHEAQAPQGHAADVFRDDGVHLGRVVFPEPVMVEDPVPHVTGEHVYAVVEHDLGVPYLVRYRIERP